MRRAEEPRDPRYETASLSADSRIRRRCLSIPRQDERTYDEPHVCDERTYADDAISGRNRRLFRGRRPARAARGRDVRRCAAHAPSWRARHCAGADRLRHARHRRRLWLSQLLRQSRCTQPPPVITADSRRRPRSCPPSAGDPQSSKVIRIGSRDAGQKSSIVSKQEEPVALKELRNATLLRAWCFRRRSRRRERRAARTAPSAAQPNRRDQARAHRDHKARWHDVSGRPGRRAASRQRRRPQRRRDHAPPAAKAAPRRRRRGTGARCADIASRSAARADRRGVPAGDAHSRSRRRRARDPPEAVRRRIRGPALLAEERRRSAGLFSRLQAKFPNELGGRQPVIRRADLGTKGIFYRTMVGPFSSAQEATSSARAKGRRRPVRAFPNQLEQAPA